MKVSSFKLAKSKENKGIKFGKRIGEKVSNLGRIVILTGANGSGKSRFLKLFKETFDHAKTDSTYCDNFEIVDNNDNTRTMTLEDAKSFDIVNYSHFDAKLQLAENFSPYVIHKAKEKLQRCNYEETALNSLLYLTDLYKGYSDESNENNNYKALHDFLEYSKEFGLDFTWEPNDKCLKLFGRRLESADLSPGQLYALRIAVACKLHCVEDNIVFLLDEPETHLHPNLLIKIINQLLKHFVNAQFLIATHSLPLISYLTITYEDSKVLFMENGEVQHFLQSNSTPILNSLIGTEEEQFAIKQLFVMPEEMACNQFCMECFMEPAVIVGGVANDPSAIMVEQSIGFPKNITPIKIVDYGAGYGRLLECLCEDGQIQSHEYYAYNVDDECATFCKDLIVSLGITGNSYGEKDKLSILEGTIDKVFMVNVLHEISPEQWQEEFRTIDKLLKDDGELIIVERENLTNGESPYINGYLMLSGIENNSNAANTLFGTENVVLNRHKEKPHIIKYTVSKNGVKYAISANMEAVLKHLENDALFMISNLRHNRGSYSQKEKYKFGLSLAFWLNQHSTAVLCQKQINNTSDIIDKIIGGSYVHN